jgi:hypothetical protein
MKRARSVTFNVPPSGVVISVRDLEAKHKIVSIAVPDSWDALIERLAVKASSWDLRIAKLARKSSSSLLVTISIGGSIAADRAGQRLGTRTSGAP